MDDVVHHCRFFLVTWTADSKGFFAYDRWMYLFADNIIPGFFYSRYPPEENEEGKGTGAAKNCKVRQPFCSLKFFLFDEPVRFTTIDSASIKTMIPLSSKYVY
jgi:hypothetical protein